MANFLWNCKFPSEYQTHKKKFNQLLFLDFFFKANREIVLGSFLCCSITKIGAVKILAMFFTETNLLALKQLATSNCRILYFRRITRKKHTIQQSAGT